MTKSESGLTLPSNWMSIGLSAIIGAAGSLITASIWVADKDYQLDAHSAQIKSLQATDLIFYEQLKDINQRLSRIEGKLDVILSSKASR